MAWPFPGGSTGPDACRVNYGRTRSCFEAWRGKEQMVAGLMLVVVVLVFMWKVVYFPFFHALNGAKGSKRSDADEWQTK